MTEKRLTVRQRKFVAALLTAPNVAAAAKEAGINERTGRRYLALDHVQAALGAAYDDTLKHASRRASAAMLDAVETLHDIVLDGGARDGARISAARAILEHGAKMREALDLVERIEALEGQGGQSTDTSE